MKKKSIFALLVMLSVCLPTIFGAEPASESPQTNPISWGIISVLTICCVALIYLLIRQKMKEKGLRKDLDLSQRDTRNVWSLIHDLDIDLRSLDKNYVYITVNMLTIIKILVNSHAKPSFVLERIDRWFHFLSKNTNARTLFEDSIVHDFSPEIILNWRNAMGLEHQEAFTQLLNHPSFKKFGQTDEVKRLQELDHERFMPK